MGDLRAPIRPRRAWRCELEGLTLLYHRPSGITHVLLPPAPEILDALAEGPADAAAIARPAGGEHVDDRWRGAPPRSSPPGWPSWRRPSWSAAGLVAACMRHALRAFASGRSASGSARPGAQPVAALQRLYAGYPAPRRRRRLHRPARAGAAVAALAAPVGGDPRRLMPARRGAAAAGAGAARRRDGHEPADGARPAALPAAPRRQRRAGRAGAADDRPSRRGQIDPGGAARRARLAAAWATNSRCSTSATAAPSLPARRQPEERGDRACWRRRSPADRLGPLLAGTPKGDIRHLRPNAEAVARMDEPARAGADPLPALRPCRAAVRPVGAAEVFVRLTQASTNYVALGERGLRRADRASSAPCPRCAIDYPDTDSARWRWSSELWARRRDERRRACSSRLLADPAGARARRGGLDRAARRRRAPKRCSAASPSGCDGLALPPRGRGDPRRCARRRAGAGAGCRRCGRRRWRGARWRRSACRSCCSRAPPMPPPGSTPGAGRSIGDLDILVPRAALDRRRGGAARRRLGVGEGGRL